MIEIMLASRPMECPSPMHTQGRLAISIHGIGHRISTLSAFGKMSILSHSNKSSSIMSGSALGLSTKIEPLSTSQSLLIGTSKNCLFPIRSRSSLEEMRLQPSQLERSTLIMMSISAILSCGGLMESESLIFTTLL